MIMNLFLTKSVERKQGENKSVNDCGKPAGVY